MFQVSVFADSLVPTVRRALCDPLPQVRQVAAHTFDHLHTNIGQRALDDILPYLLQQLVGRHTHFCYGLTVIELTYYILGHGQTVLYFIHSQSNKFF
jgi:hypothetical protein